MCGKKVSQGVLYKKKIRRSLQRGLWILRDEYLALLPEYFIHRSQSSPNSPQAVFSIHLYAQRTFPHITSSVRHRDVC